jgi:hypothetical protein
MTEVDFTTEFSTGHKKFVPELIRKALAGVPEKELIDLAREHIDSCKGCPEE